MRRVVHSPRRVRPRLLLSSPSSPFWCLESGRADARSTSPPHSPSLPSPSRRRRRPRCRRRQRRPLRRPPRDGAGVRAPLGPGANTVYVLGLLILGARPRASGPGRLERRLRRRGEPAHRPGHRHRPVHRRCPRSGAGRPPLHELGGGDYGAAADRLLGRWAGRACRVGHVCAVDPGGGRGRRSDSGPAGPRHPNVVVADWAAISGGPGFTYKDGLHLQPAGAAAMAQLVASAVAPLRPDACVGGHLRSWRDVR